MTGLARRSVLCAGAAALAPFAGRAAAVLGEDGMYHQPWFLQSFLDLPDDLATAAANGKRLAAMWELKGCPYCRETHLVNFADPAVEAYVRTNFEVVQLDVIGARPVTAMDGTKLAEKALAERNAIRFTPTIQFFAGPDERAAAGKEIARLPGYLKPADFLAYFRFVRERGYERGSLRDWLRARG